MISKIFLIAFTLIYPTNAYDVIWDTEYENADCTGEIIEQNSADLAVLDVCLLGVKNTFNGTHLSVSTCGDYHINTYDVYFKCDNGRRDILQNVDDLTILFYAGEAVGLFPNERCQFLQGKYVIFKNGLSNWFNDAGCKSGFIGHNRENYESQSLKVTLEGGGDSSKNRVMIVIAIIVAIPFILLLCYAGYITYEKRSIKRNNKPTNKSSYNV